MRCSGLNGCRLVQELLAATAQRLPNKTALVCGARRVSYGELDQTANRVANGLRAHGVQRGDRVVILLDNDVEAVASIFGVLKAGAVIVPVNPGIKDEKLWLLLQDCGAAGLICGKRGSRNASDTSSSADLITAVSSLKVLVESTCWNSSRPGACTWAEIQSCSDVAPPNNNLDLDLAAILYTSGTTGNSKGVMMDHSNFTFVLQSIAEYLEVAEQDVLLSVLPLSFSYGLNQVLITVATGGTLVLEKSFAYPVAILDRIAEEHVTGFPALPTIFALLLEAAHGQDLSSVRYITNAAAALPEAHIGRLAQLFPKARIFSMYGLTETTRALYLLPHEIAQRPASAGKAIPGTEVWIENESGGRASPGETGELVVRGRHVARGYWNNPAATHERFRPGFAGERICYTGDLFRADAEGFYYFVARKDDVIKSRGMKVAPREIEEVLHRLPGVAEAAVFGTPDPIMGQSIEAVLVTRQKDLTSAQVMAHCRLYLEDFMVPRKVHFVPVLPRTGSGKVRRTDLSLCVVSPEFST